MVCARRFHNYGARVGVAISRSAVRFSPIPAHQLSILDNMGITIYRYDQTLGKSIPDLIIDGVIGYSLKGAPRDGAAALIDWANSRAAPILSLDAPSGIDTTSGVVFEPAIKATATMTLALPKRGFLAPGIREKIGELYLADISVPPELYKRPPLNLDVSPNIFAKGDVVRIANPGST